MTESPSPTEPSELEKELVRVLQEQLWMHPCRDLYHLCPTCMQAWDTIDRYRKARKTGGWDFGCKHPTWDEALREKHPV